jgi:hypothetical protein
MLQDILYFAVKSECFQLINNGNELSEIITYFKTLALNFQFPVTLPAIT